MKTIMSVIFCLTLVACAQSPEAAADTPTAAPTRAATVTPTQSPTVAPDLELLFEDDFSDPASGWTVWDSETIFAGYENETYRIFINEPNMFDYEATPGEHTNVRVEVDVLDWGGGRDSVLGVLCRYQDPKNYNGAYISPLGYYAIVHATNAGWENLATGQFDFGQLTKPGPPRFRLDCIEGRFDFYVDDVLIASGDDDEITQGRAGLYAGAYSTPGTDVIFDNFAVFNASADDDQTLSPTETSQSTSTLEIRAFVSGTGDPVVGLQVYVTQNEGTQEIFTNSDGVAGISELSAGSVEFSPVWIIDQTTPTSCESPQLEGWKVPGLFIGDNMMAHFFGPSPEVAIQSSETTIVELEFICAN